MTTSELIKTVSIITQENIDVINKLVGNLNENQMKWRPDPGFWNIAEVLAHLNEYSRNYQPTFKRKIENTRFTSVKEVFVSSPLGRAAWKSRKLGNAKNIKRKFKAQKGSNPSLDSSLITGREFEDFIKHQTDLQSIFELAQTVNMNRVKIPISISKIVRLRLGDALLFVIYHHERHVQQVVNLVNHPNFPKS
ncbi:MAG: DinB family protein [Crocinitomicaceae bacterium]|nr:DinB family protein [Crocinitomicaceae bacterium]